jgi:hypothetical protein
MPALTSPQFVADSGTRCHCHPEREGNTRCLVGVWRARDLKSADYRVTLSTMAKLPALWLLRARNLKSVT